jgi:hypothetical protein
MGTIRSGRRFAIRLFLRSLASWKPGETEPASVYAERRGWANTVLELIGQDPADRNWLAKAIARWTAKRA